MNTYIYIAPVKQKSSEALNRAAKVTNACDSRDMRETWQVCINVCKRLVTFSVKTRFNVFFIFFPTLFYSENVEQSV